MADTTTNPYIEQIAAANPTTTVTLTDAAWGAYHRLGQVAAGDTLNFTVKTAPAVFAVQGVGATVAKNSSGFIFVNSASQVQVSGSKLALTGSTADDLVVSISSGVVTLTSPATSETKSNVWISRLI